MTSPAAALLIAPIRFYQRFITPYTPATCRYYPTCSAYGVTALRTHGAVIGTALTVWRVLRCNPWSSGGIDHVPPKGQWRRRSGDNGEHATEHEAGRDCENDRERDEAVASSTTVSSAEYRCAGTDLDAPRSAASKPMIGRSAA
jgi:putative membrane protein insertion efficiency factor